MYNVQHMQENFFLTAVCQSGCREESLLKISCNSGNFFGLRCSWVKVPNLDKPISVGTGMLLHFSLSFKIYGKVLHKSIPVGSIWQDIRYPTVAGYPVSGF